MKLDKYMTGSEIGSSKLVDAGSGVSVRLSWLIGIPIMDYDMDVSENEVKMMINHWIEAYTIFRQTHIPNYMLV